MTTASKVSSATGTHKPLVVGSNPSAATSRRNLPVSDQGITEFPQAYSHISPDHGITLKQVI
jgi:hypothetical protein